MWTPRLAATLCAVHDAHAVDVLEGQQDVADVPPCHRLGEVARLLQPGLQLPAQQQLHDEIKRVLRPPQGMLLG